MDKPLPKAIILRHTPPPTPTPTPPTDQHQHQQPTPTITSCKHCGTTTSPLWRRGERQEVLCNRCGLYWKHHNRYRPLDVSSSSSCITTTAADERHKHGHGNKRKQGTPKRTALMPIDGNLVIRNEAEPNTTNTLKAKYTDLPKRPRLRPALAPKPPASEYRLSGTSNAAVPFIMHSHQMLFPGDHVVVRGPDSLAYYAILVDFSLDPETKRKQCLLKWLLPRPDHADTIFADSHAIQPHMFLVGREHDRWEPLECIMDVFYSPYKQGVVTGLSPVLEDLEAAHLLMSISG